VQEDKNTLLLQSSAINSKSVVFLIFGWFCTIIYEPFANIDLALMVFSKNIYGTKKERQGFHPTALHLQNRLIN
jgi:hypothetical protein